MKNILESIGSILLILVLLGGCIAIIVAVAIRKKSKHKHNKHDDKFYNTLPNMDTSSSGPKYCAGCHAHLPSNMERNCPPGRCLPPTSSDSNKCNCCGKPLGRLEREDLHLYGYLVSLLHAIGVDDHLH